MMAGWIGPLAQRAALLAGSVLVTFLLIEGGYRLLDPFPYVDPSEINATERGNLTRYDRMLGWRGVPSASEELITENSRVLLSHNSLGFRDVEHPEDAGRPAIVFLGDSYTWGFEVSFDEMFVNRIRPRLPEKTIVNLSHRGYGTDQSLLTFRAWEWEGPIDRVVLMFSDNDMEDNASNMRYRKPKPMFRLHDGTLELTGVPVPEMQGWEDRGEAAAPASATPGGGGLLSRSHFLRDLLFRYWLWRHPERPYRARVAPEGLAVTEAILAELAREVRERGGELVVCLIPTQAEIDGLDTTRPYQAEIETMCRRLGIASLDLAPAFKRAWLRTYYRVGGHWNARGHRVAEETIADLLTGGDRSGR